jgi:hypothetical protein
MHIPAGECEPFHKFAMESSEKSRNSIFIDQVSVVPSNSYNEAKYERNAGKKCVLISHGRAGELPPLRLVQTFYVSK